MTAHLPNTSEIRNIYASGAVEVFYNEEEGYFPASGRESYPARTAAFDLWLSSTLAYAESLAYARGKADGQAEAAAKVTEDKPLFTVAVDPREVVSVPKTMLNTFGAPHPGEEGFVEESESGSDRPEGYAEGKAAGVAELASHVKSRLDQEAAVKLTGAGRSHQAARDSAFTAANFIVTTSEKEVLEG